MMSALFLATARPIQGGPKTGTLLYAFTRCAITSLNIHRFSNLFHSLNWENYYWSVIIFSTCHILQRSLWHLRLRNDLYCVGWGVKLYSNSNPLASVRLFKR